MVKITALSNKAEGLSGNMKILYSLPGEEVESQRLGKTRKATTIFEASPNRVDAFCEHFTVCGGCSLQHMKYEAQVRFKSEKLTKIFETRVDVEPAIQIKNYRNRMDYVINRDRVGLREKGSWKFIVDLKECPIFAKESVLKKYYEELHALPSFNIVKKEGIFKYVVIRGTGDDFAMIFCCTSQGKEYVSQLLDKFCDVPNIALTIVDGISDISMGETTQVIKGNNYYFENIGDCKFKVPLNGFIQPNPTQANELYSFVKSLVVGDELVDLFCGVGSIGIYCKPKTLYGVEVVKEAVEVAVENAKLNGVDNAHFSCVDLYKIEESDIPGNLPTIIVDPPREGLHKKTIKALLAKKCRKLIYVSCNPNSAKDNLDKLSAGFDIVSIKGFDMFPHTPHVEVVIELTPKDL